MRFCTCILGFAVGVGVAACHRRPIDARVGEPPDRATWIGPHSSCADSSARWLPATRVSDTLSPPTAAARSDQLWAWWARQVPGGWAGGPYYLASPGPTAILLRDTSQKVAALAALDTLLPPDPRGVVVRSDSIIARTARWDLAELYDWLAFIHSNLHTARGTGINGWGINPQRNRITIMIQDAATLPIVTQWLRGLGIPCELVAVEVVGPVRLTGVGHTRTQRADE